MPQTFQAKTIDEALALLSQHRDTARVVNGGTALPDEAERDTRRKPMTCPSIVFLYNNYHDREDVGPRESRESSPKFSCRFA